MPGRFLLPQIQVRHYIVDNLLLVDNLLAKIFLLQ